MKMLFYSTRLLTLDILLEQHRNLSICFTKGTICFPFVADVLTFCRYVSQSVFTVPMHDKHLSSSVHIFYVVGVAIVIEKSHYT